MIRGIDTSFLVQLEVAGHPGHAAARELRDRLLDAGDVFALAPQVLAEFLHVVTDGKRFEHPLNMNDARDRAEAWWRAPEVVGTFPTRETVPQFTSWLATHQLGRKRLLDTLLAATYLSNGVSSIVTSNARDFAVFDCFEVLTSG